MDQLFRKAPLRGVSQCFVGTSQQGDEGFSLMPQAPVISIKYLSSTYNVCKSYAMTANGAFQILDQCAYSAAWHALG